MSVLNFPRIYFNGEMSWNPPTGNNNDVFPLYDAINIELNWPFLKDYGITPDNADEKLHPWMISNQKAADYITKSPVGSAPGQYPTMPAEWDLFGDNGCETVNYQSDSGVKTTSTIIAGELKYNSYDTSDGLVGKTFQVLGNPFGGTDPTPGRFVDISPWQNTFTALYFDKLRFGDSQSGIELKREYRMLDRFLNFTWGAVGGLTTVTTTWQSCFPTDSVSWNLGSSQLLSALKQATAAPDVQGVMVRFSTYLTVYDKNGIFNDFPPVVSHGPDSSELMAMYKKGLANASDIFFNPAHSKIAGTIGLWKKGEFPTCPGGRRLTPTGAVHVPSLMIPSGTDVPLGVTLAQGDKSNVLSLDLSNTIPFTYTTPADEVPVSEKIDIGTLNLKVGDTNIASIPFSGDDGYNQASFDKRSGLLDVELSAEKYAKFEQGALQLEVEKGGKSTINATESVFTAEVVNSGTFIDVGETKNIEIMVHKNNQPAANTTLYVAEYSNAYMMGTSDYYLCFDNADLDFDLYSYDPNAQDNKSTALLPEFADQTPPPAASLVDSVNFSSMFAVTRATQKPVERMVATQCPVEKTDSSVELVSYQQVLKQPIGVSLTSMLDMENSSKKTRQLNNAEKSTVVYQVAQVTTDENGIATLQVTGKAPGFPTLVFNINDDNFDFSFELTDAYTDFLAPVRVLPTNGDLMTDFKNTWNKIYQEQDARIQIWQDFIYPKIFKVFYYLYPIMDKYMPLNDLHRIESAVDQLIVLISSEYRDESTLAMPITRDLPGSSRAVLELWVNKLVKRNYPPVKLE